MHHRHKGLPGRKIGTGAIKIHRSQQHRPKPKPPSHQQGISIAQARAHHGIAPVRHFQPPGPRDQGPSQITLFGIRHQRQGRMGETRQCHPDGFAADPFRAQSGRQQPFALRIAPVVIKFRQSPAARRHQQPPASLHPRREAPGSGVRQFRDISQDHDIVVSKRLHRSRPAHWDDLGVQRDRWFVLVVRLARVVTGSLQSGSRGQGQSCKRPRPFQKGSAGIAIHDEHPQPVHYLTDTVHGVIQGQIIRHRQFRLHHHAAGLFELMEKPHRLASSGSQLPHPAILQRLAFHQQIQSPRRDGFGAGIFHRHLDGNGPVHPHHFAGITDLRERSIPERGGQGIPPQNHLWFGRQRLHPCGQRLPAGLVFGLPTQILPICEHDDFLGRIGPPGQRNRRCRQRIECRHPPAAWLQPVQGIRYVQPVHHRLRQPRHRHRPGQDHTEGTSGGCLFHNLPRLCHRRFKQRAGRPGAPPLHRRRGVQHDRDVLASTGAEPFQIPLTLKIDRRCAQHRQQPRHAHQNPKPFPVPPQHQRGGETHQSHQKRRQHHQPRHRRSRRNKRPRHCKRQQSHQQTARRQQQRLLQLNPLLPRLHRLQQKQHRPPIQHLGSAAVQEMDDNRNRDGSEAAEEREIEEGHGAER